MSRGREKTGGGYPDLDDVIGSGDFEGMSTRKDERGNSEGLGSEHFACSFVRGDLIGAVACGSLSTSVRGNDCVLRQRGLRR